MSFDYDRECFERLRDEGREADECDRVVPCLTASIGQRIVTRSGRTVRVVAVSWANVDKPEYVVVDAQGRESMEFGHAWIRGRVEVA